MNRFGFPQSRRLLSNRQFRAVLARGRSARDRLLTVYIAENNCGYARLGVSVGKSCGNAILRNRLKRLLREAFRLSREDIPGDFDYVVMISPQWTEQPSGSRAKRAWAELTLEQARASFLGLVAKAVAKTGRRSAMDADMPNNGPESGT